MHQLRTVNHQLIDEMFYFCGLNAKLVQSHNYFIYGNSQQI